MSSHHVIREDQEPALLIIDPLAISFEKIQELLEWSPFVIISQQALEIVSQWGIKIDILLIRDTEGESHQYHLEQDSARIISLQKNETDLATACQVLHSRKQMNLNVVVTNTETIFHTASVSFEKINAVLLSGKNRWQYVQDGKWSKWLPAKTHITIFSDNHFENIEVKETGIYKIHRTYSFWLGEEL